MLQIQLSFHLEILSPAKIGKLECSFINGLLDIQTDEILRETF